MSLVGGKCQARTSLHSSPTLPRVAGNPSLISLLTACVVSAGYNVIRSSGFEFESPRRPFVPRLRGYPHPCEQTFTLLQRYPPVGGSLARERVGADTEERRSAAAYLGARDAPYADLDGCFAPPLRRTWCMLHPSRRPVRQPPGILSYSALYGFQCKRSHYQTSRFQHRLFLCALPFSPSRLPLDHDP